MDCRASSCCSLLLLCHLLQVQVSRFTGQVALDLPLALPLARRRPPSPLLSASESGIRTGVDSDSKPEAQAKVSITIA
jgi:hypothetical protein